MLLMAVCGSAWGQVNGIMWFTSDAGQYSFANNEEVSTLTHEGFFVVTFDKGSGSTTPKYFSNGDAIRAYAKNTITVTSDKEGYVLTKVVLGFASSGDGSNEITANNGTFDGTTWEGSDYSVVFTIGGTNGHRRIQYIHVWLGTTDDLPAPTFSPAAGEVDAGTEVIISNGSAAASYEIYYTTDGTSPVENNAAQGGSATETVTINGEPGEAVTITAAVTDGEGKWSEEVTAVYTVKDPNGAGSENNPYTVVQARAAIDAGTGVTGVYAKGIVSKIVTAYNSQFGNITYNISDDGTTDADQLQAYRGKSYEGAWFISADDIQVGDQVVIYGNLKKYNTTYEFDADNQLVSLIRTEVPVTIPAPTFDPAAGEVEEGTVVTISTDADADYEIYYTLDGTSPVGNNAAEGGNATESVTISGEPGDEVTITAVATDGDGHFSEEVVAVYTVKAPVEVEEPAEAELPEGVLFWEQFSQVEGTGGRDDVYTGTVASSDIFGNSSDGEHTRTTDMIWEYLSKDFKCYGAKESMKFGTGSANGEFMTREIELSGNGTLTFSAAGWGSGTNTLIVQVLGGFAIDEGETQATTKEITLANGTWTDYSYNLIKSAETTSGGNLQVRFTGKRGFIDDIKVVEAGAVTVDAPTITPEGGVFTEPVEVTISSGQAGADVTLYYTLDGTDPDNTSTEYTAPFTVTETTTVKAVAYIGETPSNVAQATFTFPTVVNSIAEFRQLEIGETAILNLDKAQVLVAAGNNVYVRDAGSDASFTANAICFYQCDFGNTTVTSGSVISGQLTGTRADFNGLPELTNAQDVSIIVGNEQGDNTWVKNVENLADVTVDNYVADLIMFEGTVTKNGNNFFIGDNQLYVNNQVAAANSVYGGNVASGDKIADLVEDGKNYLVAGIFTSYGNNKTPELMLMHVEEKDEVVEVEYTFNSYGIGTLYYSDLRFDELPQGVTASYISGIEGKVLTEQDFTTENGSFIPCGCPVILRGTPGSTVMLTGKKKSVEGETPNDNMLRGTDEEESCELFDTEYLYYQLSAKNGDVGFYWGADGGAPFINGAHKAFLALTSKQAAFAPVFYFNGTTGITAVAADGMIDPNQPMYNLAGQRVSGSYKGVVIQNGVKQVRK